MTRMKDKIGGMGMDYRCSCGKIATFMCDCGGLCCDDDPCEFNCGGSVLDLQIQLDKGIKPRGRIR